MAVITAIAVAPGNTDGHRHIGEASNHSKNRDGERLTLHVWSWFFWSKCCHKMELVDALEFFGPQASVICPRRTL
jgi:hypothetical protein